MKTLAFSFLAVAALALLEYQHQQLARLRAENANLHQAASEANQLQADLAKSTGDATQNEQEITRLREENRDLLKLRNQVSQLHEAQAAFEKVSAENKRLQSQVATIPTPNTKQIPMQPILIRVDSLYDHGLSTPENALQTFFWAEGHAENDEALSRCVTPESWQRFGDRNRLNLDRFASIEIVARRDLNATTVQLGIQLHSANASGRDNKGIITLMLQNGEWRVDISKF